MQDLMPASDPYLLDAPPVNEVGFSFATNGPFVDPYDIRAAHDLFREDYPKVERQIPVAQLDVVPLSLGHAVVGEEDVGVPPRWWFIAENGSELVQVQERFLGWNWRRGVPPDAKVDYPGFDTLHGKARDALNRLVEWNNEKNGSAIPPSVVQLMYDNMIVLRTDDETIRVGDVLECWNSSEPGVPTFGWNVHWYENMAGGTILGQPVDLTKISAVLVVNLSLVGVISSQGSPLSVLRMRFTASRSVSSWKDGFAFLPTAHDYIRKTFVRLVTDKIQASWGKR